MRAARLLVGVEPLVGVLGQPRDGALDAAACARRRRGAGARPSRALPQLEQRGRQQRQRAGLALDVGEQRVDELRLDAQAGALRRALDRAAQLVARIGPTSTWLAPSSARQLRVGGAAAVEVGAHGEHDDAVARASRDERVDERRALAPRRGRR